MAEPAPKVEAARASAAKPRVAPEVSPAVASDHINAEVAPTVESAVAAPPTERGSFAKSSAKHIDVAVAEQNQLGVDALRKTKRVLFEAHAAVIVGPVERNTCDRLLPCFSERSFISYGEVKRYVLLVDGSILVYTDIMDPKPMYTIQLLELLPEREDPIKPDFYSHTISPEANTGLPFSNRSKESLGSVLLKDSKGSIMFQFAFDTNETGSDAPDKFITAVLSSKGGTKKL
ncbi:hypothetical protein ACHAWF_003049 [Thalassiosira exigua]